MKNKLYKLIVFSFVFGASHFTASAQVNCGTDEATQKLRQQHPELSAAFDNYNTDLTQYLQNRTPEERSGSQVYYIPIVFHIIHENGPENISDAQIFDQMAIMNRDWRKLNADTSNIRAGFNQKRFSPALYAIDSNYANDSIRIAADVHIEFRLAKIDPNGNCTNGIDRIYSHKTVGADDRSKLNPWPRDKYMNVWIVKSMANTGAAGYAYYPSDVAGPLAPYDGVILLYNYIGSIGTGSVGTSRTLTHEIAHCFSLQHVWGNTNNPGVSCGDDLVSDTPWTKGHTTCSTDDLNGHVCSNIPLKNSTYQFNSVTTSSGNIDPTVNTTSDNVILGSAKAIGVSPNSSANGKFEFSNWDLGAANGATNYSTFTGAVNNGKYYEFTITPKTTDSSMTLTSITFKVNRSATGPRTWVVRSNASFTTNLTPTISPANPNLTIPASSSVFMMKYDSTASQIGCKINLSGPPYTNKITPITFRIYAYNAEDALGTFGIDSVNFVGTNGAIENTQNYMEYSYCSNMFTNGQRDRMEAALHSPVSHRNNLWSASNLAATGVAPASAMCVAHPEFFSNKSRVCAGDIVKYTANILYGTPDSVRWTFYGGTPATSTSMAPVNVTYNTAGLYKVTLTSYNGAGTDSVVKTDFIRVDPTWADISYTGSYTETFENTTGFYWSWQVNNLDNNSQTWYLTNTTGYQSNKSVVMSAYGDYRFDVDELVSPSFDLSFTSGNMLTFRVAAASHAGDAIDVNDQLKVFASKNCGNTWNLLATYGDSSGINTLINNGYDGYYFTPTASSVWSLKNIPLSSSFSTGNVRFKFEYTSGTQSNNVYLDDFNITGVVGIDPNNDAISSVTIYPNPTSQTSTVAYHLEKKAATKIEVMDVLGKTVFVQSNSGQAEGDYSVQISKQSLNLRNGIYFVKFSVDDKTTTKKLIITE